MKTEVDKLGINNKLFNVPTNSKILKTKVDDLDVGKLKAFPVGLKKLHAVANNQVVKNTKFNTLKTKVNIKVNIAQNIPDATTLININQ